MGDTVVLNNKVTVDLDLVIREGLNHLKSQTGVNMENYQIENDKIILTLQGDPENITILKDRLGIEDSKSAISDSKVNRFKERLDTILRDDFKDYTIKLKSIDKTDCIIFVYLTVNIPTIPYPVNVNFKLYEDGFIDMGYMLFGAKDSDERWSATSIDSQRFIETLKSIKAYYLSKNELPE